jgi:hypothetical protein
MFEAILKEKGKGQKGKVKSEQEMVSASPLPFPFFLLPFVLRFLVEQFGDGAL